MQRKDIETKLGKINFAYRKGNPLVVCLNGFGSFDTVQSFSKVIEALPSEYGYFAPDYLNSGFSGKSLNDYTVSDEADVLARIINDFKAEKVVILAHSIGGVYAMQIKDKINNLKAFVGIEPTTREVILNPPKDPAYTEKNTKEISSETLELKYFSKDKLPPIFNEQHQLFIERYFAENYPFIE